MLYEDENDGYAYEKGAHATIALHWDDGAKTLTIGAREGSFPGDAGGAYVQACVVVGGSWGGDWGDGGGGQDG